MLEMMRLGDNKGWHWKSSYWDSCWKEEEYLLHFQHLGQRWRFSDEIGYTMLIKVLVLIGWEIFLSTWCHEKLIVCCHLIQRKIRLKTEQEFDKPLTSLSVSKPEYTFISTNLFPKYNIRVFGSFILYFRDFFTFKILDSPSELIISIL